MTIFIYANSIYMSSVIVKWLSFQSQNGESIATQSRMIKNSGIGSNAINPTPSHSFCSRCVSIVEFPSPIKWAPAWFQVCNFLPLLNVDFPSIITLITNLHLFISGTSPSFNLFQFINQPKLHQLLWKSNEVKVLLQTVVHPNLWSSYL